MSLGLFGGRKQEADGIFVIPCYESFKALKKGLDNVPVQGS
jgi:hypothetical protein